MSQLPQFRVATRRGLSIGLAGLTAAGALFLTSACSSNSTPAAAPAPDATAPAAPAPDASAPVAAAPGGHHRKGIAGKITAEDGNSWTVVNAKGKQFTVTITAQTAFGTKKQPATQQEFVVGSSIRAMGQVQKGTVTAARITAAHPKATAAPDTAPAPSTDNGTG
jgi:hypothetical protein